MIWCRDTDGKEGPYSDLGQEGEVIGRKDVNTLCQEGGLQCYSKYIEKTASANI